MISSSLFIDDGCVLDAETGVTSDMPPPKSPRRMNEGEKLTFEEIKVVELFKKLSNKSQRKVLDAMEDHMDEIEEQEKYRAAAEEEKRIKQRKLDMLKEEEEKQKKKEKRMSTGPTPLPRTSGLTSNAAKVQQIKIEEQKQNEAGEKRKSLEAQALELHKITAEQKAEQLRTGGSTEIISPAREEEERQRAIEAEIARLRHIEMEEQRKIHELKVCILGPVSHCLNYFNNTFCKDANKRERRVWKENWSSWCSRQRRA